MDAHRRKRLGRVLARVARHRERLGLRARLRPVGNPDLQLDQDRGSNETKPINCLTWFRAYAFCIWDGGFLPSEVEWEYAASGGQERLYPWSSPPADATVDPGHASYDCLGDGVAGCSLADIVDVGTKSAGAARWGQVDMGGNLWELVMDWYAPSYAACSDCAQLTSATNRVIRGGVYNDKASSLRAANRHTHAPAVRGANVGVRCARP